MFPSIVCIQIAGGLSDVSMSRKLIKLVNYAKII